MSHQSDSDRIDDWKKAIGTLILIHQHIRDLDADRIWGHELPGVAASEEDLAGVEAVLGEPLDRRYRIFLAHANGWRAFYQWVDLFGTKDLLDQPMKAARERFGTLAKQGVLSTHDLNSADALPIAMTRSAEPPDVDLFVIVKPRRPRAGQVIWLASDEVDHFPTFDSFFLAMLDYNRAEVTQLMEEARRRGRLM